MVYSILRTTEYFEEPVGIFNFTYHKILLRASWYTQLYVPQNTFKSLMVYSILRTTEYL